MSTNSRYWTTKSLSLAAYLFTKGDTIAGVHTSEDAPLFVFVNTAELHAHISEHKIGPALVDARLYDYAFRQLQGQAADALMETYGEA